MTSPQEKHRSELHFDVQQFYYDEASLLDERRYEEWLDLFTDDSRYVIPIRSLRSREDIRNEFGGEHDIAHVDDTKHHLAMRVNRLTSGIAWADEPASRSRHVVGNVRIMDTGPAETKVHSSVLIWHGRGEHEGRVYSAARHDILRSTEQGWRIARRSVLVDMTVLPSNLGVFF